LTHSERTCSYALNQPLEVRPGTPVTIDFRQSIAATEGLRTGAYGKTLTFTLSTTTP
jgi:hypothetical protein